MNSLGKFILLAGVLAVIYSAYTVYQGTKGFNPASIERVKQSIRDDFDGKNIAVVDVNMLRRTPRELVGFVKIKEPASSEPQQKACTATMADDNVNYVWKCQ